MTRDFEMSDLQGTHDLKRCILTVGGRRITGHGETDAVNVVFDEQRYNKKYGADGEVSRSKLNAEGGTIVVTVHQTNAEAIAYLDEVGRRESPLDVVPISFTDLETGQGFIAGECWLQKEPDRAWNRESGDRVYTFDTGTIRILS